MYRESDEQHSLLARAALSHLDLALTNLAAQSHALQKKDRATINDAVARLKAFTWVSEQDPHLKALSEQDLESPTPKFSIRSQFLERLDDERRDMRTLGGTEVFAEINSAKPSTIDGMMLRDQLRCLTELFSQLDVGKAGAIKLGEWIKIMDSLGLPVAEAEVFFQAVDTSGDGQLDRNEWLHLLDKLQQGTCSDEILKFVNTLVSLRTKNGRVYVQPIAPKHFCILRPDSALRISWDAFILVILAYVSLITPYKLGFETLDKTITDALENITGIVFMMDIVLNFRTGHYYKDVLCMDAKQIAYRYLTTWFVVDFVSCVPWDDLSDVMPHLQPVRMIKIGKVLQAMKLLRLGRFRMLCSESEFVDAVQEKLSYTQQTLLKACLLVLSLMLICHWVACFMPLSGKWFVAVSNDYLLTYPAAMYWAMMTMTTVGYGDVAPADDSARLFATGAMVVGGLFYAFWVGKTCATISARDSTSIAATERMRMVRSWLAYHSELPLSLRRRIRRHFQKHLKMLGAEDSSIIDDLSISLQHDVSFYLVHEEVRYNPLFHALPNGALEHIMPILEKKEFEEGEVIVSSGDAGDGMYIIISGSVIFIPRWASDTDITPSSSHALDRHDASRALIVGDSFGEEVLLSFEEVYHYTATAKTFSTVLYVSKEAFAKKFRGMPDIMHRMKANFLSNGKTLDGKDSRKKYRQRSSSMVSNKNSSPSIVSPKNNSALPAEISTAVVNALGQIGLQLNETHGKLTRLEESWIGSVPPRFDKKCCSL